MEAEFPRFYVTSLLHALGIFTGKPVSECFLLHASLTSWQLCYRCGDAHEPKAITGRGPEGSAEGWGRGLFTEQDKARLLYFVCGKRAEHV